jgi:ATP-dependent Clp protease ATP-binding subunit ClpC
MGPPAHTTERGEDKSDQNGRRQKERSAMFERFTPRARHAVAVAQEEADRLDHNFVGTEHLLLGLLREDEGIAAKVLLRLGITYDRVQRRVEERMGRGTATSAGSAAFTPRAKQALKEALGAALSLGHNYIGTEHILLGLMKVKEGVAADVLTEMGATLPWVHMEVAKALSGFTGSLTLGHPPERRRRQVVGEINDLFDENVRLRDLLKRYGIDPDTGEKTA